MKAFTQLAILALSIARAAPVAAAPGDHNWVQAIKNFTTTGTSFLDGALFYAANDSVVMRKAAGGALIGAAWSTPTSNTIQNFPISVPLQDTLTYVFVAANDGVVYKLLADPIAGLSLAASRSFRRPGTGGCTVQDALQATPAVQLKSYSNAGFTRTQDLVFVPTFHGCGDTSLNQVIALDAATLATVWVFNAGGEYAVDYISQGCSIDYTNNRLYCGANLPLAHAQNTVFAISTIDGSLVWAANMGSVHARPQLGYSSPQHLYVADMTGRVHGLDPSTGHEDWTTVLSGHASVTQNLWAEFRDPYANLLFVTDSLGRLTALYDGGSAEGDGVQMWQRAFDPPKKVISFPAVSPGSGKVYVGLNDGTLHQIAISSGADEATRNISNTPSNGDFVTDPMLYVKGGASDINAVVASSYGASGGFMKEFSVPFNASAGTMRIPRRRPPIDPACCRDATMAAPHVTFATHVGRARAQPARTARGGSLHAQCSGALLRNRQPSSDGFRREVCP